MDERDKWNVRTKEGYLKIHVAVNVKTKKKILLSMKEVTDDEHVHNDSSSKELPELVDNIIKSDSMTTTTTIDKLFADGGASMKAMRFLGICGR
jgi:hypothetical protein